MLSLFIGWRLVRRFHRGLVVSLVSIQLALLPIHSARAVLLPVVVPIAILAARVFHLAAAAMGSGLTAVGLTATEAAAGGLIGAGLMEFVDRNWPAIVTYMRNSSPSYAAEVSAGQPSYASLATAANINTVQTDTTSYSWSAVPGAVTAQVGNVPMKDPLAVEGGGSGFPTETRWDGHLKYLPLPAHSFSTIFNSSGFKTYLCPVLSPSINEPDAACRLLPEMPYAAYKYQSSYSSIGAGCDHPQDCARSYVAARLLHLSGTIGTGTNPVGQPNFMYAIRNVTTGFASCFDGRFSQYSSFTNWRCPVSLSYERATLTPGDSNPVFATFTEQLNIDVLVQRPSFQSATSINDYIDRYPLAGGEPVMPASLAAVFNAMFAAAAAKPGYSGLEYFPITAAHVSSALQPGEIVPLSEFAKPLGAVGTGTLPGTGTGNPPGTGTTVDLGPNPGIAAPVLEGIPTAAQIMSPIFDLFPSVRNFQVPGHTGACPAFVVPVFGQDVSTNKHCELIEQQRSVIGAAALVGWSITAIIIVLGA